MRSAFGWSEAFYSNVAQPKWLSKTITDARHEEFARLGVGLEVVVRGSPRMWARLRGLRGRFQLWRRARFVMTDPISSLGFFFLPERQGRKRECTLCMDGVRFKARWQDWVAVEETVFKGEHDFVRDLIEGSEPVVVDLGANIGLFSLRLYSWSGGARFFLAEPSRHTTDLLRRNVAMNPAMRSRVVEAAIWTQDGSIEFHEDPGASTAAAIGRRNTTTASSQVPCLSFGSFLQHCSLSSIDILKMDIEGAEQAVLDHGRDLLPRVATFIVEVHPPSSSVEHVAALLADAFPFLYLIGGRASAKPLFVATRRPHDTLPRYAA